MASLQNSPAIHRTLFPNSFSQVHTPNNPLNHFRIVSLYDNVKVNFVSAARVTEARSVSML